MEPKNEYLLQKLYTLFGSKCFDDFTFNCKDGKVAANRLLLSVYSRFLKQVFESNPNIVKHPLLDHTDFGINLPEINTNALQLLLKVVYASEAKKVLLSDLKKLQNVAKILRISLKTSKSANGYIAVAAIPDGFNESKQESQSEIDKDKIKVETNAAGSDKRCNDRQIGSHFDDKIDASDSDNDSLSGSDFDAKMNGNSNDSNSPFNAEDLDSNEALANAPSIVCEICHITCKSWRGLKSHYGHVHKSNDLNRSLSQPKIVCKCGLTFAFKSRKLWKQHKINCEAFRREGFICEVCEMPFDSLYAMKNHQHSAHGISVKARTCVCGYSFPNSHSYRKHQNECEVLRSVALICDDCEMPFVGKGGLMQHLNATGHRCRKIEESESFRFFSAMENKDGPERKVCKCGKSFAKNSRDLFREHRVKCVAFMADAFVCEVCKAPFADTFSLNTHKYKAHGILTGANRCACGIKFRNSYSYRKHRINCESYKQIAVFCNDCNIPFASEKHLQFHLESGVHSEIATSALEND